MRLTLILFVAACLMSVSAHAGPAAPQPAVAKSATIVKANPDDRIICKHFDEPGSRLGGRRICLKKSQWDQQSADAEQFMMQPTADGAIKAH